MATLWDKPLDPSDLDFFIANFVDDVPVLGEDETIASFIAEPTDTAAGYGLTIESVGDYAPSKTLEDKAVLLWLSVPEDKRDNVEFCPGIELEVEVSIITSSVPPRKIQRTWAVRVENL